MRDNAWLAKQLESLLNKYFSDVKLTNPLEIRFGREAKYRFGSIKLYKPKGGGLRRLFDPKKPPEKSLITVTSMFAKDKIPEEIVQYTIGHELCHYAHGFSSYNKRMFAHPHHGGVINAELTKRGARHLITAFKKWLKNYRETIRKSREDL